MERLAHTYGKTWHTWHTDQDKALPKGVPQLMMGLPQMGRLTRRWSNSAIGAWESTLRKLKPSGLTFVFLMQIHRRMAGRSVMSFKSPIQPVPMYIALQQLHHPLRISHSLSCQHA